MRFGDLDLDFAEGALLAHAIVLPDVKLSKGHRLANCDIDHLRRAGLSKVVAAQLDDTDVDENQAAARLANSLPQQGLRCSSAATGRVNVYATVDGLCLVDRQAVDALNGVDWSITLATLADGVSVKKGDMVATIKIIPLAVPGASLLSATRLLEVGNPLRVLPFRSHAVTMVSTLLPALKQSTMNKTRAIFARRLRRSASEIVAELRVRHDASSLATALRSVADKSQDPPTLVVVFGASAVIDRGDVIPEAISRAGGEVIRVGIPVDPGNLLVLGTLGNVPVIGAPGCARSPKENGFDWVLDRVLAGSLPTHAELGRLGVGGLLTEIQSRPHLRETIPILE